MEERLLDILFCRYDRSAFFFSGHVPCKFFFSNFFSEGEGGD